MPGRRRRPAVCPRCVHALAAALVCAAVGALLAAHALLAAEAPPPLGRFGDTFNVKAPAKQGLERTPSWALHGVLEGSVPGLPAPVAPLDRNVSDFRDESCVRAFGAGTGQLPRTTVVLVVTPKELAEPVLRTVHGVLNRSPEAALAEILLCDDAGEGDEAVPSGGWWLRDPVVMRHVAGLPKTRIVRFGRGRVGLLMARQKAVEMAVGEVVTFIDSYAEVAPGWLEPMLAEVQADPTRIVFPKLDWEDPGTWATHKGGIGCTLGFLWHPLSEHEIPEQQKDASARGGSATASRPSPVLFGAVFSVQRAFFLRLGGFDPEFGFGGSGENVELSFRAWLCGGSVRCAPCSRVFVTFYKEHTNGQRPGHPAHRNKLRTAALWMDGYADIVRAAVGAPAETDALVGPLGERQRLKEGLRCRPFQWFLDNVYPEGQIVGEGSLVAFGQFYSVGAGQCLDTMQRLDFKAQPGLYPCGKAGQSSQLFLLLRVGQLLPLQRAELCLSAAAAWYPCEAGPPRPRPWRGPRAQWSYDPGTGALRETTSGSCLAAAEAGGLEVQACQEDREAQRWRLQSYEDFKVQTGRGPRLGKEHL